MYVCVYMCLGCVCDLPVEHVFLFMVESADVVEHANRNIRMLWDSQHPGVSLWVLLNTVLLLCTLSPIQVLSSSQPA